MRSKDFFFVFVLLLYGAGPLFAWGPEGHRVIGLSAYELLDETARQAVVSILGDPAPGALPGALGAACNWPDTVRDEPGWRWSSPLHYVNIARHAEHYDRERDCREGRCVTEGILHFASQLTWPVAEPEKRLQAFSFVCHLVADLHQPLHAGFRDDRGGNTIDVIYRGESGNLHQFWDGVVVRERLGDEGRMVAALSGAARDGTDRGWNPGDIAAWTDESHALAVRQGYPEGRVIDDAFAGQAWSITVMQWEKASGRLARILNALLGEGQAVTGD